MGFLRVVLFRSSTQWPGARKSNSCRLVQLVLVSLGAGCALRAIASGRSSSLASASRLTGARAATFRCRCADAGPGGGIATERSRIWPVYLRPSWPLAKSGCNPSKIVYVHDTFW